MTVLGGTTRLDSSDDRLVAQCLVCRQTLAQVPGFDRDVALGTWFSHHPTSAEAVHRPDAPAGWRPVASSPPQPASTPPSTTCSAPVV